MTITGADERIHPVERPDADWADAVTWTVWDRAVGFLLVGRLAVLPNRPGADAVVQAWLAGRPAYVYGHRADEVPLADWDDLSVAAVRLEELAPLEAWELSVADGDNLGTLRFDAAAEAGAIEGGYQQAGRVRGEVRLAGRDVAVDGVALRTHAWGRLHAPARTMVGFLDDGDWFRLVDDELGDPGDPGGREFAARLPQPGGDVGLQGFAHGMEIVAAADGGDVVRSQPTRFATGDDRHGYGLVQHREARRAGGEPTGHEEEPCE